MIISRLVINEPLSVLAIHRLDSFHCLPLLNSHCLFHCLPREETAIIQPISPLFSLHHVRVNLRRRRRQTSEERMPAYGREKRAETTGESAFSVSRSDFTSFTGLSRFVLSCDYFPFHAYLTLTLNTGRGRIYLASSLPGKTLSLLSILNGRYSYRTVMVYISSVIAE